LDRRSSRWVYLSNVVLEFECFSCHLDRDLISQYHFSFLLQQFVNKFLVICKA
jgi:hypothetical protein